MAMTGWTRRHKITIDYTKVSGGANLTNFPVLLTEANFYSTVFDNTQLAGQDLRFTSDVDGNTELAFEIVNWDTVNDKAEVWVKIPTLSYTANTVIYVWYGNSSASAYAETDTYGARAVWRTEFKGVWHMNESSGVRYDSTGNNNDLTDNNTVGSAVGKIGTAADFEYDNTEYLSITDANQTGLDITGNISIKTIVSLEELVSTHTRNSYRLVSKWDSSAGANRGFTLYINSADGISLLISPDGNFTLGNTFQQNSDANIFTSGDVGNPVVLDMTWEAATKTWKVYKNGSAVTLAAVYDNNATSIYNNTANFQIGAINNTPTANSVMDGLIDETRVLNTVLTQGWIVTEYNNLNSPSTFATESDDTTFSTTTNRTQTGKARITATATKTQTGKSRVTASTNRTQLGKARMTVSTPRTQVGKSRVTVTTGRTQVGKSRMTVAIPQDQHGIALIAEPGVTTQNRTQSGKARVTVTTTRAQVGKAAIQLQQNRDQIGRAKIQIVTTNKNQIGKAAIKKTVTRDQTGKARLQFVQSRIQTGKAKIVLVQSRTQVGKARIKRTESHTQIGKASIRNYADKYVVQNTVYTNKY